MTSWIFLMRILASIGSEAVAGASWSVLRWAWLLALHLKLEANGVFWAVFVSETAVGLFTLWLFSRGSWKDVKV